jgi:hypothetical protein
MALPSCFKLEMTYFNLHFLTRDHATICSLETTDLFTLG